MSLEIIQLSNYIRPEVKEVMSKEYVLNGDKNSFYQYIIDRYNGSPTNRAIIDSYAQFIYGKGLTSKQMNTKPVQFAMIGQILSKKNLKNICFDYYLFGESSMELIYEKGTLKQILHIPKNQVCPSKMNEEGDIESYWYSLDFNNIRKYPPLEIPKFDIKEKKNGSFIYIISNYQVGKTYFADPSYLAALPYAELEEEIANYCINHIKNGLSFGHIFNMNNGEPESPEVKRKILAEIKVEGKGSSNANKTFVNWNLGADTAITISSLEVSDAHKQYEFLSGESSQKLITGHRVVSPMLFGIKDSTGFGNNADEMESAFNELMINVIQPKQEVVLDALMEVFIDNGMTIDLDFIPLRKIVQPTQLSAHTHEEIDPIIADSLIELGETLDLNEWESVDEEPYSETSIKLSEVSLNLARTIYGQPNKSSDLDTNFFKVRFEYAGNLAPEREFCRKMISAGKVFRLEDIENAGSKAVNPGWGAHGANTYDILKYKGGGNCKHYWLRKIYLKKNNSYITVEKAQKMIRDLKSLGVKEELPKSGEPLSTIKPNDMPNNGFLKPRN